jgi:hypothetical protein
MLAQIQDKHPWFWEMKALISERPNMVPVGVGNNSTPINILLLQKPDTAGLGDGEAICFRDLEDFDSQSKPWIDGLLGRDDGDEGARNEDAQGNANDKGGGEDGSDGDIVGRK